ncbi:g12781 [Coccomyxa viridis]|uniref:Ferritin n=1 Tax=Coccomyxa viridis TaxID=1274662 RepID=A0ABP1GDU9_9CHLO
MSCNASAGKGKLTTEVTFNPFREVEPQLEALSGTGNGLNEVPEHSLARVDYALEAEYGVNEQINVEYNISYIYHSMFAYFDRDNVGLPGFARYFMEASHDERHHAELLMRQQTLRGGRVKLQTIMVPETEYTHKEKGEALYAMELALSLEKLNFTKLRELWKIANEAEDGQLTDFIEGQLLHQQAIDIKQAAIYVSELRRVGKGLGVFEFDRYLQQDLAEREDGLRPLIHPLKSLAAKAD